MSDSSSSSEEDFGDWIVYEKTKCDESSSSTDEEDFGDWIVYEECNGLAKNRCSDAKFMSGGRYICKHYNAGVTRPDLVDQMKPEDNGGKSLYDYLPRSSVKIVWTCPKFVPGLCSCDKHKWVATVQARVICNNGCPWCTKYTKKLCPHGDDNLAGIFPEVAKYWSKKNDLPPNYHKPYSNHEAIWECPNCPSGNKKCHRYKMPISIRVGSKGCPYCAGMRMCKHSHSLQNDFPDIASQWHPSNKGSPSIHSIHSKARIKWICPKGCREGVSDCGVEHIWFSRIDTRVKSAHRRSLGCPYCSKTRSKYCYHSTLEYKYPKIAAELHPDNEITADTCLPSSDEKVKWLCSICKYVYYMQIKSRTLNKGYGASCPKCRASFGEKLVYSYLEENNIPFKQEWKELKGLSEFSRYDFYCESCPSSVIIEYDGKQHFKRMDYFHDDLPFTEARRRDIFKHLLAITHGFKIIRLDYTLRSIEDVREHLTRGFDCDGKVSYFSNPDMYSWMQEAEQKYHKKLMPGKMSLRRRIDLCKKIAAKLSTKVDVEFEDVK